VSGVIRGSLGLESGSPAADYDEWWRVLFEPESPLNTGLKARHRL
jgi:hypothetical protein